MVCTQADYNSRFSLLIGLIIRIHTGGGVNLSYLYVVQLVIGRLVGLQAVLAGSSFEATQCA